MFYFEQACWKIVSFRKPKPAVARNKQETKHPAIFTPVNEGLQQADYQHITTLLNMPMLGLTVLKLCPSDSSSPLPTG